MNYLNLNEQIKKDILEAVSVRNLDRQKELASHSSFEVREHLADNPYIFHEIQYKLALDVYHRVKSKLAANLNIDLKIQELLSEDENSSVRFSLFCNLNLLPEICRKLLPEYGSSIQVEAIKKYGINYNHPETRKILETYLLLV